MKKWMKPETAKGLFLKDAVIAFLVVLLLELTVFNFSFWTSPQGKERPLELTDATIYNQGEISGSDIIILSDDATSFSFGFDPTDLKNAAVTLYNPSGRAKTAKVDVAVKDKNLSLDFTTVFSLSETIVGEDTGYFRLSSPGASELRITVTDGAGLALKAVSLNAKIPFRFHIFRFFLALILALVILAIKRFELYRAQVNLKSVRQRFAAALALILAVSSLAALALAHGEMLTPYDGDANKKEPYYQMFDAERKGQKNLDITVEEELKDAGELAYDSQWRGQQGIYNGWDRAFFDGKYYSYFGVAPLYLVYYPTYFITGKLPSTAAATGFLAVLCAVFGFILIFRLSSKVIKNGNFILTLLSAMTLPLFSGFYILTAYGDFYNVPKMCAMAFLLLFYLLSIEGYEKPKWVTFLLAGIAAGGIVASRPNVALMALALAPLYIAVLMKKDVAVKKKAGFVAAFFVPILAVGAALMAYNAARFGSPFEFGTKYQLTVNNIAYNNRSLSMLPEAVFHYFFQPPQALTAFPFFAPQMLYLSGYTRYFYITAAFGVFALPFNWSIFTYPAIAKKSGMKKPYGWVVILTVVMSVVTAFLNFTMAGLTISYVCDIAMMISIAATIVMLCTEKRIIKYRAIHKAVYILFGVMIAVSAFLAVMLLLSTQPYFVRETLSAFYNTIQSMFRL